MTTLRRRKGVLAGPSLYFTRIDNGADTWRRWHRRSYVNRAARRDKSAARAHGALRVCCHRRQAPTCHRPDRPADRPASVQF
jgi:hypothetical protein